VTESLRYAGQDCDLLVALHARRSAEAVFRFAEQRPGRPIVVALTGTDVYRDIHADRGAQRVLDLATRLIALQPQARDELEPRWRAKVRVVYQSAPKTPGPHRPSRRFFNLCVAGHLREVKDPMRAAMAARLLPEWSRIRVLHAGAAMEEDLGQAARAEQQINARYRWLGEIPRWKVRRLIASSHLLVSTSRMEGAGNAVSEALVDGTPVVASRISGSIGMLGADYPGYFPYGDTEALARLLVRAETDPRFYDRLKARCARRAPLFDPAREKAAWVTILKEL